MSIIRSLAMVLLAFALAGCGEKAELAFVVNGSARFWDLAESGVIAASKDFNIKAEFLVPKGDAADQKRILEDLMTRGAKGIAVTAIDPVNQRELYDKVADTTFLITHDSDAPQTKRRYYVGVDNYMAGHEAGKLLKEAMPDGGTIMIFVGGMDQLNARQRRQGLIDQVFDRPMQDGDNLKIDPPNEVIKNDKYTILGTLTDGFNAAKSLQLAEDALTNHTDMGCMVGLFEYNPPAILQAVKSAGRLGRTKIVGFDEADDTLVGINEGHIHGTVAQQPYEYGYQSIKILTGLVRGDKTLLPDKTVIHLPPIIVRKEGPDKAQPVGDGKIYTVNAKAFREDVNAKLKARSDAKKK